jgi:MoaA/NifB/PqqE/SkfB family radical SAM enzyme
MHYNKIIRIKQNEPELMHVTWLINNICPNACTYCPVQLHNGQNHHYDWENARKFFKILFKKYKKIHCSVSGGEASVSPFFKEIVKTFYEAGHTIGVTSNAAKPAHYWEEISKHLNYICFSYHPEFPDKNFLEKISVAGLHTLVTVRIMMHPKYWNQCLDVYNSCIDINHINIEPVRIFNWNGGSDSSSSEYTDSQLDWFKNNSGSHRYLTHLHGKIQVANINSVFYFENNETDDRPNTVDYINAELTNFEGYTCEVGLKELFIDWSGDVYLGNCMINGTIGNINDPEGIQWPTNPLVCTKTLCHCTTSVNINKWID